jgi:hypothetical protein
LCWSISIHGADARPQIQSQNLNHKARATRPNRGIFLPNMTSQRLYGIVKYLDSLDQKLALQTTLEAIRDTLTSLVSSPGQPTAQTTLANSLATLTTAVANMAAAITPSQAELIREIGGADFFDPTMAEKIQSSIQTHAMTPSVAQAFVQEFATKRATFLTTIKAARQALEKLGVTDSDLKPGSADASFLIPKEIFDGDLGLFARELKFITRLVQHFTEAQTGNTEPVLLEQLSSSTPVVSIAANLAALGLLATVIKQFLEAWLKFEEVREVRARLAKMGFKGKALEELDEQVATSISEVIEQSTELVIRNYPGTPQRKNELANAIRKDTGHLFSQIERGLTVEFRAAAQAEAEPEKKTQLDQIASVAKVLQFPKITNEPLMLGTGEIPEDTEEENGSVEILKHSTKTITTKKTTTEKKGQEKTGD